MLSKFTSNNRWCGSGLAYSNLGTTHHSIEDIGVLNSISNLNIISPADSKELKVLLPQVLKAKKPVYFRIGKKMKKQFIKINVDLSWENQVFYKKEKKYVFLVLKYINQCN